MSDIKVYELEVSLDLPGDPEKYEIITPAKLEAMSDPQTYIPPHTRPGVVRYIEFGIAPGDFLTLLFNNDLKGAFMRADSENLQYIAPMVAWLWNYAPTPCWGRPDAVAHWIKERRQDNAET